MSFFLKDPDIVIDHGASLGRGTNNVAELVGLGITNLITLSSTYPYLTKAIVFCDSKLALRAATSIRASRVNNDLSVAVKKAYVAALNCVDIDLQWIRGHVNYGGHERVDRISKSFASTKMNNQPATMNLVFNSQSHQSDWIPSYPLTNVPPFFFQMNLMKPIDLCLSKDSFYTSNRTEVLSKTFSNSHYSSEGLVWTSQE